MESLESRQLLAAVGQLVGGVDPYNMGKGDWIWDLSAARTNTGTTSVQGLVDYMKARGFKWIVVKAGDGNNGPGTGLYTQWNKDLVDRAHAAGLKIFAYHFIYGGVTPNGKNAPTTIAGEKAVISKIMSYNPDGLILDAESEWERLANANTVAEGYGKYFKDRFPTKLLGHAPFAYANLHSSFPYQGLGKYADVVMPQMYWETISLAGTPEKIIADVNSAWKKLYNDFEAAGKSDSIKPIVPIGQGYDPSPGDPLPPSEITQFFQLLRNDPDPASPFGYNGVGFWSLQHHTDDHIVAIANGTISAPTGTISGLVFNDIDGDGAKDLGETGIAGRTVYDDTDNDGVKDAYEPFAKTNSAGVYTIPYMAGRVHRIRQVVPGGERQSLPSGGLSQTVALAVGQKAIDRNFAATATALINGNVFNDKDSNGNKVASEPGLPGVTLYLDTNNNAVLDSGEASTTTDSKGNYSFTVVGGTYHLREVNPVGTRTTSPASGFYDVTIGGGESTIKFFGNTSNILIKGAVFNDKNFNGVKDAGENALAGWRVFVDGDGDGVFDTEEEYSVLTDANGNYRLTNIGAGNWRVQVFVPGGWQATVPGSAARKIKVASGGSTSNKNFGVTPIT